MGGVRETEKKRPPPPRAGKENIFDVITFHLSNLDGKYTDHHQILAEFLKEAAVLGCFESSLSSWLCSLAKLEAEIGEQPQPIVIAGCWHYAGLLLAFCSMDNHASKPVVKPKIQWHP
ncbi:hypothetical protein AMECASPLE_026306 [Ameca splendens]|uniref:Uncharacterized protein n=1 Tax=Ameca splendens TaxID=208324 RepID=A0ABV0XHT8_9TELE